MGSEKLSVIVPFVNEWPQLVFTLGSIAEELRDRVNFEIIAIDNWCKEAEEQNRSPDRGHKQLYEIEKLQPWLKVVKYKKRLSHWQAKRKGVNISTGDILWFCDAHCLVSRDALFNMFNYFCEHREELDGTLHLPLTYQILESRVLIYKLRAKVEKHTYHYSFTPFRPATEPYEVPCMSTCGMMMDRALYDELGGWPVELGIYGGGENFLNYSLSVIGKKKWIFPSPPLRHHGDRRGYNYEGKDYIRNRAIAHYIFGGQDVLQEFMKHQRGSPRALHNMYINVMNTCEAHRELIKSKQVITIQEWVKQWRKEDGPAAIDKSGECQEADSSKAGTAQAAA